MDVWCEIKSKLSCVQLWKVMWSETVGIRTRPVSDQKYRSWCCVV